MSNIRTSKKYAKYHYVCNLSCAHANCMRTYHHICMHIIRNLQINMQKVWCTGTISTVDLNICRNLWSVWICKHSFNIQHIRGICMCKYQKPWIILILYAEYVLTLLKPHIYKQRKFDWPSGTTTTLTSTTVWGTWLGQLRFGGSQEQVDFVSGYVI